MYDYANTISIEMLPGGFVLTYPAKIADSNPDSEIMFENRREVFTSSRKLYQKIKEVIDSSSLVSTTE